MRLRHVWDEPVPGPCPSCGSPVLAIKRPPFRKPYICCPERNVPTVRSPDGDGEE